MTGRAPARAPARSRRARLASTHSTASRALTKASYIPSPESGSTRPAASPASSTRPLRARSPGRRIGSRKPRTDSSRSAGTPYSRAGPLEVLAQARPFRLPAADPDVDVVALRKDPRVAARDGAELDDRPAAVVLARVNMVDVALERDAVRAVALSPSARTVSPLTPSAPIATGAVAAEPPKRTVTECSSTSSAVARTPSRKSAPAAAACSARYASRRRRCVIRISGPSVCRSMLRS